MALVRLVRPRGLLGDRIECPSERVARTRPADRSASRLALLRSAHVVGPAPRTSSRRGVCRRLHGLTSSSLYRLVSFGHGALGSGLGSIAAAAEPRYWFFRLIERGRGVISSACLPLLSSAVMALAPGALIRRGAGSISPAYAALALKHAVRASATADRFTVCASGPRQLTVAKRAVVDPGAGLDLLRRGVGRRARHGLMLLAARFSPLAVRIVLVAIRENEERARRRRLSHTVQKLIAFVLSVDRRPLAGPVRVHQSAVPLRAAVGGRLGRAHRHG